MDSFTTSLAFTASFTETWNAMLISSFLGNHQEALNDATAAVRLEPASIEAIEMGKIHRSRLIMRTPPIHLQTPLLCVKKSITIIPNS